MSPISVSPATEAEAPAALAMLGRMFEPGLELLVARRNGQVAGAAGLHWRHARKLEGFSLSLGVRPPHRRQGVGRALAAAAVDMTAGEAHRLWSQDAIDEDSVAAAFARACGFEPGVREHHFRADADGVAAVTPMIEWFVAGQPIPDSARVIPLREAPLEEVAWLLSAEFGDGPGAALARLRHDDQTGGIDLDESVAVMAGEELAAFYLASLRDGSLRIDVVVVAPPWRGGWANMLLMQAMLGRRGVACALRFQCTDETLFTMKIARRLKAVCERTTAYYFRAVP